MPKISAEFQSTNFAGHCWACLTRVAQWAGPNVAWVGEPYVIENTLVI